MLISGVIFILITTKVIVIPLTSRYRVSRATLVNYFVCGQSGTGLLS
jgi:hypothetical protein